MASWRKFLYPVRQSLNVITSSCSSTFPPRQLFNSKLEPLKGLEPLLRIRASRFQWKLNGQPKCSQNFRFSGSKLGVGSILGVSAVCGAISFWSHVAYAMDGHDILVHDHEESYGASDVEEDLRALWKFARKLWLCHQSMRQEPHLYHLKSLYAHKVEVQDYKLLCLATVEVRDQKFTLIGVLGGWWAWPWLQSHGVLSLLKYKDRIIETLQNTKT